MEPLDPSLRSLSRPPRKRLQRYEHTHHLRFLTFSTHQRLPLLGNERIRDLFASHLARARVAFSFNLYAWVVMPEHVHLLLWPLLPEFSVSVVTSDLKRRFARGVIARWKALGAPILERLTAPDGTTRFWQRGGGYDRNIFSHDELAEKIAYIHANPVKRGLVSRPEEWAWSSARWYAGERVGAVEIDPLPPAKPMRRNPPGEDATARS